MKNILSLLALLFLASCTDSADDFTVLLENNENKAKVKEISLKGENLITSNLFGQITDIRYSNDALYLLDASSTNVISKLHLENNELIPLIKRGEGPNEIDDGSFIKINAVKNGKIEFHEFYNAFINHVDETQPFIILEGMKIPEEHLGAQATLDIDNSSIAVVGSTESSTFSVIKNGETKTLDLLDHLGYERELSEEEKRIAMPKNIGYENNNLFFWRNQYNTVELYSDNGQSLKTYKFGENENITKDGLIRKFTYYFDVKAHGKYLYATYAGFNTLEDFTEDLIPHLKTEVHIFNTETDEVVRFKFDRLINYCSIDFDNKTIYAVEENNEKHPIVKYNFQENI